LKYGASSGLTIGTLILEKLHVRTDEHTLTRHVETVNDFQFFNQYVVLSRNENSFFAMGDSGSLVSMVDKDNETCLKPFGLAIATTSFKGCVVTPLDEVFKRLGLDVTKGIHIFHAHQDPEVLIDRTSPSEASRSSSPDRSDPLKSMMREMMSMVKTIGDRTERLEKEVADIRDRLPNQQLEQDELDKKKKRPLYYMISILVIVLSGFFFLMC